MKFRDIKKFPHASCHVHVSWTYLQDALDRFEDYYGLEMQPEFQRGYVWTEEQQIAYLEYQLRGGFSGRDIFFNSKNWVGNRVPSVVQCVDGQQRIGAVQAFLGNKIPAFGTLYSDFEDKLNPMEPRFSFYINNLTSEREVVEWYVSLNTGGSIHTKEDLKPAYEMLEKLSK